MNGEEGEEISWEDRLRAIFRWDRALLADNPGFQVQTLHRLEGVVESEGP